jgi:hypothetical protein
VSSAANNSPQPDELSIIHKEWFCCLDGKWVKYHHPWATARGYHAYSTILVRYVFSDGSANVHQIQGQPARTMTSSEIALAMLSAKEE